MMSSGEELGHLPVTSSKVEKLCLTSCRNLTDRGLQGLLLGIGNNLKELDLSKSCVTGEGFQLQSVKSLPNLEKLNLSGNTHLTDDGLCQISKTCGNKLKKLNLSFTPITGIKLDKKQSLMFPCLQTLNLRMCMKLSVEGLIGLLWNSRYSLRELDLSETDASLVGLEKGVESLPNLEKLNLDDSLGLSNKGLIEVLRISGTHMKELYLYSTFITGTGIEANVRSLPSLQILDLSYSSDFTDEGLYEILKICGTKLRELNLSSTNITGTGIEANVRSLPSLQILDLSSSKITDNGFHEILRICGTKLRELNLSSTNITGTGIEANVRSLPSLLILDLSSSKITDNGFQEILRICGTKLIDLTLSSTNITGVGLEERVKCLPSLQILCLDDSDIRDEGLHEILTVKRKRMKTIHVTRDQISTTFENIRKSCQSVCINFAIL